MDGEQQVVVALPNDASGVVAGAPGSGKTEALLARVQSLLAAGLAPSEVLVLTPTRQSATDLRDRLALAVGVATPGALARSVSAFAFSIVRAAAGRAGASPPRLLTGPDEDTILRDLLDGDAEDERAGPSRWPAWLGADIRATPGFRAELRAFFAECLARGIDPESLTEEVECWPAVASFARDYRRVRAQMRGDHRDAAELVHEATRIVRTTPVAEALGGAEALEGVRVLLVDDAQELTAGGVDLLLACRDRGIAVLALGDPDVGSGGFRGAGPENFARLSAAMPVHVLKGAHRGTPSMLDVVADVTSRIGATGMVAHRRAPGGADLDDSVRAFALRSAAEEYDIIARLLRERHVEDGIPWRQCAVIAHDTRQVTALETELAARDVPTAGVVGRPLASRRAVREMLGVVELAAQPEDRWTDEEVEHALTAIGLDVVGLRRLRIALRTAALGVADVRAADVGAAGVGAAGAAAPGDGTHAPVGRDLLVEALSHPVIADVIDTREGRVAARLGRAIALLRTQLAGDGTAHELLWTVWEASGRERAWTTAAQGSGTVAEQARRDLDAVSALFQAAKRHGERGDGTAPIAFLRSIRGSDVAEDRLAAPPAEAAVRVLTPAAALGAQFDTVVVAGVQEGVWPNLRARGSLLETWRLAELGRPATHTVDRRRAMLHDELRLFARAVSRAHDRLIVTAVDDDDTGPSVLFEFLPPAQPAPQTAQHPLTLRGLVAAHRRTLTVPGDGDRQTAAEQLALLADAGVEGADPAHWYGAVAPTSTGPMGTRGAVRVSPSRLHTIEQCALDWVIGELGGDTGSAVAGLGTVIHAALEHAGTADEDQLWRDVRSHWGELEFEAPWRDRAEQARARDLVRRLAAYLRDFEAGGGTLLGAEPHFEIPLRVVDGVVEIDRAYAGVGNGSHGSPEPTPTAAVLSGYIDRVEKTAAGAVEIVDLKTGKREPQTDAKVADHPQLAAYQLAFEAGAVPSAAGLAPGGAKLLVLRPTAASKMYATPHQPPLDDEARTAFLARVGAAIAVMRDDAFTAPYEQHCRDDHSYGLCRIHTIGSVSAS